VLGTSAFSYRAGLLGFMRGGVISPRFLHPLGGLLVFFRKIVNSLMGVHLGKMIFRFSPPIFHPPHTLILPRSVGSGGRSPL